jgi:hypothetical protein
VGFQPCSQRASKRLVFKSNASGLAFWRSVGAEERSSIALFSLAAENAG